MYAYCSTKKKLVRKPILLEGMQFNFFMLPNLKPNAKEDYMIFLTTLPLRERLLLCIEVDGRLKASFSS